MLGRHRAIREDVDDLRRRREAAAGTDSANLSVGDPVYRVRTDDLLIAAQKAIDAIRIEQRNRLNAKIAEALERRGAGLLGLLNRRHRTVDEAIESIPEEGAREALAWRARDLAALAAVVDTAMECRRGGREHTYLVQSAWDRVATFYPHAPEVGTYRPEPEKCQEARTPRAHVLSETPKHRALVL